MIKEFIKDSMLGKIYFKFENNSLIEILYLGRRNLKTDNKSNSTIKRILEFLKNPATDLSGLDIRLTGTDFQKKVWREIIKIPSGKTLTYKQLADKLSTHPRPVAGALRNNPLPIVYPCHRVVASSGIGGFSGKTQGEMINIKYKLLKHEGVVFDARYKYSSN